MKKYYILGISVVVIAVLFSLSLKQESPAAVIPRPCDFYGTAPAGSIVTACMLPNNSPCYKTTAGSTNTYCLYVGQEEGTYLLTNGCYQIVSTYSGTAVECNFCVPTPERPNCPCN